MIIRLFLLIMVIYASPLVMAHQQQYRGWQGNRMNSQNFNRAVVRQNNWNFNRQNVNRNWNWQRNPNWNWNRQHNWNRRQVIIYPAIPYYYYSYPAYTYPAVIDNSAVTTEVYQPQVNQTVDTTQQAEIYNWIDATNGYIPPNAIMIQDETGNNIYSCRAQLRNEVYYGKLVPNEGCYIEDRANAVTLRFHQYQVRTH